MMLKSFLILLDALSKLIRYVSTLTYSVIIIIYEPTCLLDNYGIIQTSTSMVSGRKGDTLIRFEIQGGFVRFSYKKSPQNRF